MKGIIKVVGIIHDTRVILLKGAQVVDTLLCKGVSGATFRMKEPYEDILLKYIHVRYLPKERLIAAKEIEEGVTVTLEYEFDKAWSPYFIPAKEQDNEAYIYDQRMKEKQKKKDNGTTKKD
jgi:hypothetical protein